MGVVLVPPRKSRSRCAASGAAMGQHPVLYEHPARVLGRCRRLVDHPPAPGEGASEPAAGLMGARRRPDRRSGITQLFPADHRMMLLSVALLLKWADPKNSRPSQSTSSRPERGISPAVRRPRAHGSACPTEARRPVHVCGPEQSKPPCSQAVGGAVGGAAPHMRVADARDGDPQRLALSGGSSLGVRTRAQRFRASETSQAVTSITLASDHRRPRRG